MSSARGGGEATLGFQVNSHHLLQALHPSYRVQRVLHQPVTGDLGLSAALLFAASGMRVTGFRCSSAFAAGEAQKTVQSEYVVNASSAASPAAELPEGPSAGLHTQATPRSGMTARMPPPTPLLAGSPTR